MAGIFPAAVRSERVMRKSSLFVPLAAVLLATPFALIAQDVVVVGLRVRVHIEGGEPVTGTVVEMKPDTLVVARTPIDVIGIPSRLIVGVDAAAGRRHPFGRGLLIGGLAGGFVGTGDALLRGGLCAGCSTSHSDQRALKGCERGLVGGMALGTIAALLFPTERWRPIGRSAASLRGGAGSVLLGFSVPFAVPRLSH